jgi:hypothetical protein
VQPTEGFLNLPRVCFIVPLTPTSKLQKDHGAKVVCIRKKSVLFPRHYTNGSTIYALRVIMEKLEELTSSMTSHERTLKELEQVHVAELSLLSEKVEKVSSEQAKRHEDEVARQYSHRRTSRRGMHSRSRSSSQSPERARHSTTGNLSCIPVLTNKNCSLKEVLEFRNLHHLSVLEMLFRTILS